jgi:hypothetical protein
MFMPSDLAAPQLIADRAIADEAFLAVMIGVSPILD